MTLSLTVLVVVSQWNSQPFQVQVDSRDRVLSQIMAVDAQLRRTEATWATPLLIGTIAATTVSFGLTAVLGLRPNDAGNILGMMLGSMAGVTSLIGAVTTGIIAYVDATKRSDLDIRRQRLLDEYERLEHGVPTPPAYFR